MNKRWGNKLLIILSNKTIINLFIHLWQKKIFFTDLNDSKKKKIKIS